VKQAGQTTSRVALFLLRAGKIRIGARAFSSLGGLCGPESAIRSGLRLKAGDLSPSRFSSETWKESRREAASSGLLCPCAALWLARARLAFIALRVAVRNRKFRFFELEEFCFAYF
jgi:hypothetical protein